VDLGRVGRDEEAKTVHDALSSPMAQPKGECGCHDNDNFYKDDQEHN
jgi:hypothetical protein